MNSQFLFAQLKPFFTQYWEQLLILNPAIPHQELLYRHYSIYDFYSNRPKNFALSRNYQHTFGITYRQQWQLLGNALNNAPSSYAIRYEIVLLDDGSETQASQSALLLGGAFVKEEAGPISFTSIYGRLAYRGGTENSTGFNYSLGLSVVANQFYYDGNIALLNDPNDPIGGNKFSKWFLTANAGFLLEQRFGSNHITNTRFGWSFNFFPKNVSEESESLEIQHYILVGITHNFGNFGSGRGNKVLRTIEFLGWGKKVRGLPLELAFNLRLAMDLQPNNVRKSSRWIAWLGFGSNLGVPKSNCCGSFYVDPSIVFIAKNIQWKFGLVYGWNLYRDQILSPFGPTREGNFNFSIGHPK